MLPWYSRAWAWVVRVAESVVGRDRVEPDTFELGPDWKLGAGASPTYSHVKATSAFAAFPTTFAAASRRANDLSGIELYTALDRKGTKRVEHPVLDLLEQPNSAQTGVELLRQLYIDRRQTGNAYVLVIEDARGPVSLIRLHPERIEPIPGVLGLPVGYRNRQTQETFSPEAILHIRGPSWEDDTRALHGTSPMLALDSTLEAEREMMDFTARQAKIGRPSAVISPSDEEGGWSQEQSEQVAAEYADKVRDGGALVNRFKAEVKLVEGVTPVDMQARETRNANREDVLAVLEVPPVMIGVPGQNYAESEQQTIVYWQSQVAEAALWAPVWTKLARKFKGARGRVYVLYDFSPVPALQRARNSQLDRVKVLVELGASPKEAAEFEGLADAPLPDEAPAKTAPQDPSKLRPPNDAPSNEPAEVDEEPDRGGDDDEKNVILFDDWYERSSEDERQAGTAEKRAVLWSTWARTLQEPYEARLEARVALELRRQRGRVLAAIKASERSLAVNGDEVVRAINGIEQVFDYEAEVESMTQAISGIMADALRAGFEREIVLLEAPALTFDTADEVAARMASDVSSKITTTSAKQIKAKVDAHLRDGTTVTELQAEVEALGTFKRARAHTIARTESAHPINVGQRQAQETAWAAGIEFESVWLSARDSEVRESHEALDGEAIAAGESFTSPTSGYSAPGPSQFGVAEEDINCRCTTFSRRIE